MGLCFVPDCKHYSSKHPYLCFKFFFFYKRKDRDPSEFAKVCDGHFLNKVKKNGPTVFDFSIQKKLNIKSSEKRKRTVKNLVSEPLPGPSTKLLPGSSKRDHEVTQIKLDALLLIPSSAFQDAENYFLRQQVVELTEKLEKLSTRFSYEIVKNKDYNVLMYTDIPTNELFMALFEPMDSIKLKYSGWNVQIIPKIDQLNLSHEDLSIRFSCSTAAVTNIIMTWIYALHEVLFNNLMKTIPSRQRNQAYLPIAFTNFKNCRIILDCTEIYSAVPAST
ncbi:uncharacterized protein LOC130896578 [Diorhabda carinulata]|uniref:uncharacterized protein LOC130896578 n=1 Tax=Diorhabda carinulata TaxID=1163345 RepID=UPI0025A06013|nr:uncharacterized protein LOC130896578 [Diorhabda carinulata]